MRSHQGTFLSPGRLSPSLVLHCQQKGKHNFQYLGFSFFPNCLLEAVCVYVVVFMKNQDYLWCICHFAPSWISPFGSWARKGTSRNFHQSGLSEWAVHKTLVLKFWFRISVVASPCFAPRCRLGCYSWFKFVKRMVLYLQITFSSQVSQGRKMWFPPFPVDFLHGIQILSSPCLVFNNCCILIKFFYVMYVSVQTEENSNISFQRISNTCLERAYLTMILGYG